MPPDTGACTEREITSPVALCTPRGRLNADAIGWSRVPLHDCALPRSWGRRKRWDYWCITGDGCALSVTYADVDYLGLADVWFCDFSSRETMSKSAPSPLGRAMRMPTRVAGGPLTADALGLAVLITETGDGTRIEASCAGFDADVLVHRPPGHESLSVVIPWSDERFQFTNKDVGRPVTGNVSWKGRRYELRWGTLDFGRGKWPYRTHWNWGAGAGLVGGRRIGVQLGGKWTAGTGMTENALVVDGRLSKISEELVWTYDTTDWLKPWTIRTPFSDRVDLTFTPVYDKRSRLTLGVASSSVDQCFGHYAGRIVPDDGGPVELNGVFGWAEEATWRW